ncbi:glycoside hydrolase family 18 protein [Macrolepiota fuliginosa MF-IS2]|uniref:Glycoside hydrolase family 18 protein n=1 Tax=Macrolepiota fuliginosa MF-IS2 TaxID=1400762 RepID=A0A9P6C5S0_9AGAR|nr:glycoside hydrolase family 18 protein [Macrolepiota fuliginosa MF-IS2]
MRFSATLVLILAAASAAKTHNSHPHRHHRRANSTSHSVISSAWFAGWHVADFPLDQVSWSKYTHMTYAFAITTPKPSVISLESSDQQLLPQFVATARKRGVKASLSIGGWTGSRYFSPSVGSTQNRTAFVTAVTDLVQQYSLDGIEFDWEYPGLQGIGCNVVNPDDTSNFLTFLKELRSTSTGQGLVLSAAVYTKPFADTTGQPSAKLSEFSQVLDYITIMNYDTKSTPSSGAGPDAPLDDSCAPSGSQFGSAKSSVSAWTSAGIPANQIVLGVPAYGHSFVIPPSAALSGQSTNGNETLSLYPAYTANNTRKGDRWDGDGGIDVCGNPVGPGGVYTYWGLIDEGYLNADGTIPEGIDSDFDNCSQTPFLYNQNKQIYISYDNAESFTIKGNFVNVTGLAGFAMWEAGGDYKDVLLDSISAF